MYSLISKLHLDFCNHLNVCSCLDLSYNYKHDQQDRKCTDDDRSFVAVQVVQKPRVGKPQLITIVRRKEAESIRPRAISTACAV